MATLDCTLHLSSATGRETGLAFELRKSGGQAVTVEYYAPFFGFDLTARAADGDVPVVQPHFDIGVQPVSATIAPGTSVRIETPVRLRFAPNVDPSGGDDPMVWSLRHAPAPVVVRVTLHLDGATVNPCEARWQPK
jgi:hypothetical protein